MTLRKIDKIFKFMYFLMIESSLGDHLLRLKDLPVAPGTSLSITILSLYDGGVPGHRVLSRPVDLFAADVTVDVSVRTDGKNVNAEIEIIIYINAHYSLHI